MEKPTELSSYKMFGGYNKRYKHFSPTLGCSMTFSIYFPPSSPEHKIPVLYWLSGLTCTDENFVTKSGAQRAASSEGIALIAPDTSPRGLNIEGEADSWDFGVGAGFYLNATQDKWRNWRMYDYVVKELPKILADNFEQLDTSKASISGHSMGGHGALTIYLKNPKNYKSVSAFSPVTNPINCPWGQKAFSNYLGSNKPDWEEYDATCLIKKSKKISSEILIDQLLLHARKWRTICLLGLSVCGNALSYTDKQMHGDKNTDDTKGGKICYLQGITKCLICYGLRPHASKYFLSKQVQS